MGLIIGGSGSTGSSLLAQILNRHSQIFCGPETALFTKGALYDHWLKARKKIPGKGLKGDGWHRYNGIDLPKKDFGFSAAEIRSIASATSTFKEFVDRFFQNVLEKAGKSIWAEKTPSNAISFQRIHTHFPEMQLVHCLREPYDTIASLINRGFNEFYAASLYLVNTAAAFSMYGSPVYSQIHYEDLVQKPEAVVKVLLDKMGCAFEAEMLKSSSSSIQIDGWAYSETSGIGTQSIGRFARLPEDQQQRIIDICSWIQINPVFAEKYGVVHHTIESICALSGYSFKETNAHPDSAFKRLYFKEFYTRKLKVYPNAGVQFPIQIVKPS